jgi:hypothetical protein
MAGGISADNGNRAGDRRELTQTASAIKVQNRKSVPGGVHFWPARSCKGLRPALTHAGHRGRSFTLHVVREFRAGQ